MATPQGEVHSLPASMAAVVLRADRWQVHHLGTEVPYPDLVDLAGTIGADLVVLSVTHPGAMPAAADVADQLRRFADARLLVGAPGRGLGELVSTARVLRTR